MLYKILNNEIYIKKIKYNNKIFILLTNLFSKKIYYSFYLEDSTIKYFGFSKQYCFFNRYTILKTKIFNINFCFLSYEYFNNLKKRKNFYKFFNFFSILPEFLFIFNPKKNIFFLIIRGNKKKIFYKYKKIKKFIKKKNYLKNFFLKYKKIFKKKKYKNIFFYLKKKIEKGELMQIQISKNVLLKTNINLLFFIKKRKNIGKINVFYINLIKEEILSFSPEILFKIKNKKINMFPIAGTIKRGNNLIIDIFLEFKLLNDKKEISEHLMLIDLTRNDLNKISILGKTNVINSFFLKKFFFLQHIVSNIFTKIKKKKKILNIISCLHPSGTLSGTPKIKAMNIINKLEEKGRNIYGGCFGIISKNKIILYIIIRSCVLYKKYLFIQSASGIVLDSKINYEWKELNNKLKNFFFVK